MVKLKFLEKFCWKSEKIPNKQIHRIKYPLRSLRRSDAFLLHSDDLNRPANLEGCFMCVMRLRMTLDVKSMDADVEVINCSNLPRGRYAEKDKCSTSLMVPTCR